jgi:hypothetical protein
MVMPSSEAVGIALDDGAIHEGTGVALVGIADDVLLVAWRAGGELPLEAGEKAGPAAPRNRDSLTSSYTCSGSSRQDLDQGLVAAAGDVLLDLSGSIMPQLRR